MNKGIVLLGAISVLFLFTSCASNHAAVPKAFPGSPKIFNVNNEGTVEVKVDNLKTNPYTGFLLTATTGVAVTCVVKDPRKPVRALQKNRV